MAKQKWQKKRRLQVNKFKLSIFLIITILIGGLYFVDSKINPIIEVVAKQRTHLVVTKIINAAATACFGDDLSYDELVAIHTDDSGNITLLQADSVQMSILATAVAGHIESSLSSMTSEGLLIPSGLLTGISLLSDVGPKIKVPMQPIGGVDVVIKDEFIEAGINQTKHKIYLDITISISLMLPFTKEIMEVNSILPIAETVIIGPVPDTYFDFDSSTTENSTENISQSVSEYLEESLEENLVEIAN